MYSHLIHRNREWANVGLLYALGLALCVYHAGVGRPIVLKQFFCKQSFDASFHPLVRNFWLFVWQVVQMRTFGRISFGGGQSLTALLSVWEEGATILSYCILVALL